MGSDPSRRTHLPGQKWGQLLAIPRPAVARSSNELPELLILATVRAAVRIGRDGLPPALVLSERAAGLVRHALKPRHW